MFGEVSIQGPEVLCRDRAGVDCAGSSQAGVDCAGSSQAESMHTPQRMRVNRETLTWTARTWLSRKARAELVTCLKSDRLDLM